MVWTRTRAYPNIPADARLGGKYRWDIEILPDARSPKTSTRLGEPERRRYSGVKSRRRDFTKCWSVLIGRKRPVTFTDAFPRKVFGMLDRRGEDPIAAGALEAPG
jgi:hypothetical protein